MAEPTGADRFFAEAIATLERVREQQAGNLAAAAALLVQAVASGRQIFSFGASHSFMLTEELVYRTGGLMLVNPIYPHGMNLMVRPMTMTSQLERVLGLGAELLRGTAIAAGDVLLLASVSGRNAVAIDMAQAARDQGVKVIGITSLAYTNSVTSRHPSGHKVLDLCDVVLDNGAPAGDAAVAFEGCPQPVGPLSSVTGLALVNALVCSVVDELLRRGIEPPIFQSSNLDGGDAWNARLLAENRDRIHYMT
ncbi:MAG: SIS domain-containing protein [Armatimonadetes bacterium]|nr:SIS domain-containing protein [Armatimonadota bacterium]